MTVVKKFYSDYFKTADENSLKTEYIDQSIDREKKLPKISKWDKFNILNAFNWYPSHYSLYERKFLLKFDVCILFFLSFSFYTKYLDNSNVGTAYVSGLKEDLNLHGNELNYITTCYTVGYAAFQIPTTLLIAKPQLARPLLLFCELAWGLMTLANAYVTNVQQMYVIRFFIGVFEASSFPVAYVIFSSYLTPEELFKRSGFYGACSAAGVASAGILQTTAMKHLDGVNGLSGWRWQYIIDAILTFGIFLYGFFLFPGVPTTCKKFYPFTEDDMIFARKRLENRVSIPRKWTLATLKETLTTWQFYLCSLLWVLHHKVWYSNGDILYMKSLPELFPKTAVTTWDSYINTVAVPSCLIVPPLCAYYGSFLTTNLTFVISYYSAIILIIWEVPRNVMLSSFFLQGLFGYGLAQLFFTWFSVLCRDNTEKKALVLSFAQAASYAVNAFSTPLQFNMKHSPKFRSGYIANLIIIICAHLLYFIIMFLEKYDMRYLPRFAGKRYEFDSIAELKTDEVSVEISSKQDALEIVKTISA
ncbi:hypothetical protein DAMA08_042630 [Martiniozyma asiatica (nom. inval.)]|nr:hypothetical protein DAMA08_042630 [Martiniozyma asiatica]